MDELSSIIPSYARGLPILLVDQDTTSLLYLASTLEQYSYNVTTTELPSIAMAMIRVEKSRFKLVMANIDFEDANTASFLHFVLKEDIPLISISLERGENVARRAIANGACLHLEKPITLNDIKYLWQYALRKDYMNSKTICSENYQGVRSKKINTVNHEANYDHLGNVVLKDSSCTEKKAKTKRTYDDNDDGDGDEYKEMMRNDKKYCNPNIDSEKGINNEEGAKEDDKKKSRLLWNKELHHKFTIAVNALGDKKARPKSILKLMNEPNLTHRQIASHLQKYKAQVQRASRSNNVDNASSTPPTHGKVGILPTLQRNNSLLMSDLGQNKTSQFPFSSDTSNQFPKLPQESTAPINSTSLYQNQRQYFPNVPQDIHRGLHVTTLQQQHSTDHYPITSLNQTNLLPPLNQAQPIFPFKPDSLNQSQVLVTPCTGTTMPNANIDFDLTDHGQINGGNSYGLDLEVDTTRADHSENQNQRCSPDRLADLLKVLDDEELNDDHECRGGSCIQPHPAQVDQFCQMLKEAMLGN